MNWMTGMSRSVTALDEALADSGKVEHFFDEHNPSGEA